MPVAHACPVCGNQLTRTRAVLDAVYSLPIVRCECGHVAVRRRHPITVRWRRAMLIAEAVARLVLQLILVALLAGFTAACVRGLEHDLRDLKYRPPSFFSALFFNSRDHERLVRTWGMDRNGYVFLAAFAAVSLAAGVWLRTGLGHWRWPRQYLAWILLVCVISWVDLIFWPLNWALGKITDGAAHYTGPNTSQSINIATILGGSLVLTLLATPLGYGLARLTPIARRFLFSRRLAKYRKRRSAS